MPEQKTENKSIEESTSLDLSQLDERDLLMMDFRILGLKYKDIAAKMIKSGYADINENTVKFVFSIKGKLIDIYPDYKKDVLSKRIEEGNNLVKAHYVNALKSLISKMGHDESYAVAAAREVIERAAGKMPNIQFNFDQESLDEENADWRKSADKAKEQIKKINE